MKSTPDENQSEDAALPVTPALTWLQEFVPRRFLSNGHLQTIAGNFLPREFNLPPAESLYVEVDAATRSQVLCHCHWQPEEVRSRRLTVVLVHGLEGSSSSQYVIGNAGRAWAAGCNIVRMNMRNCGGNDHLSPTLYHSGLSGDVGAVVEHVVAQHGLSAVAIIGYSMGGNLVLKLAGERGLGIPQLKAVVGVSPAMDLAASAAAMHLPPNRVYEWRFLLALLKRFRHKASLFPQIYSLDRLSGVRSLWDFDERVTAYYSGFESAADYYYRAASSRVVEGIAVPTLVLHSLDDPFIRMLPETRAALLANPNVTLVETEHGGHCAFLAPAEGYDGYWAEKTLLGFLLETCDIQNEAL
ncbi:MAG TPA: alpha/beta fold hydrolase [Acidisarcina sp.]|nr:alpha/beta fold hydrolase [Acidisarcina sp.]